MNPEELFVVSGDDEGRLCRNEVPQNDAAPFQEFLVYPRRKHHSNININIIVLVMFRQDIYL